MECSTRILALSFLAIVVSACDPGADPETDAGVDSGAPDASADDGGAGDGGADADTDAGLSDGGIPCVGPPGLYADDACTIVAPGVRPFEPRYGLWTDGAAKERFVYLPPGTQIDTSDPDNWVYPVGTRLYKSFYQGGVRLETRLLEKTSDSTGPGGWAMRAFRWNLARDQVTEVTRAGVAERQNVLGTDHDIPSEAQCIECHSGLRDTAIGFSAIQLNHPDAGVTLQDLMDEGLLTDSIAPADARVPGDATQSAALGYLHANCGHCHHAPLPVSPPAMETCHTAACIAGLHLWVDVGIATAETTDAYLTGANQLSSFPLPTAPCRIHPGNPDTSALVVRMSARGGPTQMPPLGTEVAHVEGTDAVRAWIATLSGANARCIP